jgi:hypothetical protein
MGSRCAHGSVSTLPRIAGDGRDFRECLEDFAGADVTRVEDAVRSAQEHQPLRAAAGREYLRLRRE